jgi:hypothetical protein
MTKRPRITAELAALLERAAGIWAASADREGNPETARVMGSQVRDKGRALTVYLPTEQAGRTLRNLEEHPELTVFFATMTEYRALQVKGEVVAVRETDAADRKAQEAFRQMYIEQATSVGVARAVVSRVIFWPSTAVDLAVREIYVQTPGPQAGTPCP